MVGFNEANTVGPKEWITKPKLVDATRPDKTNVEVVLSPFSRIRDNVLHIYNEQHGIFYDVPTDGEANVLLQSNESGELVPLASASMSLIDGVPTVTMIQRVKASIAEENIPESKPNDLFKITAIYDQITHPKIDLLQGENKIKWQEILLNQCSEIAKEQGYNRVRLVSGFSSKYAEIGHNLPLAIQQYDYLVNDSQEWFPIDKQDRKIDSDARQELSRIVKQVRNKKIKTVEEIKQKFPDTPLPTCWEKIFEPTTSTIDMNFGPTGRS